MAIVYDGMTVELALAILKEAKSGGVLDDDLPDGGEDAIELADYYVEEARKAFDAGMRSDVVTAILNLAGEDKTQSESAPALDQESKNAAIAESYPRRSSGGLSESDERETENAPDPGTTERRKIDTSLHHENLPVPKDWEEDASEMPRDLTQLEDIKIRSLHGEYNAYLARARYLLVIEKSDLRNASILRDEALRKAMLGIDKIDPETKKSKTNALIEAEAMGDKSYKQFAERAAEHQTRVDVFQTLVDIYSGNVSTLSREWTMRQDEWNKTR